jgi:hypothetical protein
MMLLLILLSRGSASLRSTLLGALFYSALAACVIILHTTNLESASQAVHSYNNVAREPGAIGLAAFSSKPLHYMEFFLRMLGSPFARGFGFDPMVASLVIGSLLLIAFLASSVVVLIRWKDKAFREAALPWLALGGFAIACGAAVAWGRAGFSSPSRALVPRYITLVHFLPAALLVLVPLIIRQFALTARLRSAALVGGGGAITGLMAIWMSALPPLGSWQSARLMAKAELTLLPIAKRQAQSLLDGESTFLEAQAEFLDGKGLIDPPLLREPWLEAFRMDERPAKHSRAKLAPPQFDGAKVLLSGYAELPTGDRPADAVLICAEEEGKYRIFAIAETKIDAGEEPFHVDYEFTAKYWARNNARAHWDASLPLDLFKAKREWTAWMLDIKEKKVRRIEGAYCPERTGNPVP